MSVRIGGEEWPTVSDAAEELKVSPKTIDNWIAKGVLPQPPTVERGLGEIRVFPSSYMKKAKRALERNREERRRRQSKNKGGRKR